MIQLYHTSNHEQLSAQDSVDSDSIRQLPPNTSPARRAASDFSSNIPSALNTNTESFSPSFNNLFSILKQR